MKKRINLLTILALTFVLFINILDVKAGTVNFTINSADTVTVNNTIDVTVRVSDITGFANGLATAQGDIHFDDNYLEYVKFTKASSSLSISYGTTTKRFVALGMSGEYIESADDLITLTFRAKQVGTTTVSIDNIVVGDTKAIVHSASAGSKTIEIVASGTDSSKDEKTVPASTTTESTSKKENTSSKTKSSSSSSTKSSSDNSKTNNKSSNNNLESLTANNAKISPAFSSSTISYDIVIPNDIDKLDLDYKTSDASAKVKVTGNNNLKTGSKISVTVTAEDGSTKTYTLNITKTTDNGNSKLIKLKVKESKISPKFNSDVMDYVISLPKNTKKLTIDAIAADKDSTVEIIDNNDLNDDSVVLIKVTNKNGYTSYYKLKTKTDNDLKLFGIKVKYIIIILLLLFIILLLLFRRKKKKEAYQDDLYDDVVTKDEILDAIEENDKKKLKMLIKQEEANRLKDELKRSTQTKNGISKGEIIEAIENKDKKKLKTLLKQEEENHKEKIKKEKEKTLDEEIKDELVDAIQGKDVKKLQELIDREKNKNEF